MVLYNLTLFQSRFTRDRLMQLSFLSFWVEVIRCPLTCAYWVFFCHGDWSERIGVFFINLGYLCFLNVTSKTSLINFLGWISSWLHRTTSLFWVAIISPITYKFNIKRQVFRRFIYAHKIMRLSHWCSVIFKDLLHLSRADRHPNWTSARKNNVEEFSFLSDWDYVSLNWLLQVAEIRSNVDVFVRFKFLLLKIGNLGYGDGHLLCFFRLAQSLRFL